MGERTIIGRTIRDPDDASGQSVRAWRLTVADGSATLTGGDHEDAYAPISCRTEDVEQLIADLRRLVK